MKRSSFLALVTPIPLLPFVTPINVALVAPFSGPQQQAGEQLANGARQAIDDANQFRTALGKPFALRTFDDSNALASAILEAQFACSDQSIVAVIGHLSGKITERVETTYRDARMPLIVPASSYDGVTTQLMPNVFRLPTKDSTEGRLAARLIASDYHAKKVAILTQDGDYGPNVAAGFAQAAAQEKLDARIVRFSYDKPDFAAAANQALQNAPDVVYLAGVADDMGPILKALRDAGFTGRYVASEGFFDAATITRFGSYAEGLVASASMPPLHLAPAAEQTESDFRTRYGALTPLSAFAYAAAQIIIAAVGRGSPNRVAIAQTIANGSFDTLVGNFRFGYDGEPADPNLYFYTVRKGEWVYLKAAHPTSFVIK